MAPHAGNTPNNSANQLPMFHSVLLSISGDSKISLQHTSVQQLSAIPEDREIDVFEDEYCDEDGNPTYGPPILMEDEYDEPHVLIQDPAPDGGYGWVIVIASFLCNLIVDGIAYTFGLFFQHLLVHYGTSKSKVALVASLLNGCYLGVGPIVSSLANRFGCRFVTILGSVIACIALCLSTLAPNIETLMLTYGVMGGIGFGMIYLPAIVSVGYYFTTKRALATGVAVCGSGIGAFLFAPFCQYLLGVTSWQNTLLILAALTLCCSVFGSLMRPLKIHAETVFEVDEDDVQDLQDNEFRKPLMQRIAEEKRRRLLAHSNSQFLLMMQQNGSYDLEDPTFNELKARLTINTEPGVHSTLYLDQLFAESPVPTPTPPAPSAQQSQSQLHLEKHQLSPIMEKKIVSIDKLTSSEDNSAETLNSITKDETDTNEEKEKPNNKEGDKENGDNNDDEMDDGDQKNAIVDADTAPASPKPDFVPLSPDKLGSSIFPSITTLPQSPMIDGQNSRNGFTGSGAQLMRNRRTATMRTVSDCSSIIHVANSANLMLGNNNNNNNNISTSGQLPVQVILTTTPSHTGSQVTWNGKDSKLSQRTSSTQTIQVRPLAKKDIFYSGSILQLPNASLQHMANSGVSIGQSMVSIPARDIIEKVQRHMQKREQEELDAVTILEEDEDGQLRNSKLRQIRQRNFCNKIVKILCPFRDELDCYRSTRVSNKQQELNEMNEDEVDELNGNAKKACLDPNEPPEDVPLKKPWWQRFSLPPSMRSILSEMMDMSLLRESSAFTILAISNVIGMLGFYVPFIYITQFAVSSVQDGDSLVTDDRAALLISVIGITSTVGRLLFGYLSDVIGRTGTIAGLRVTALTLNNVCVIVAGMSVMAVPYCTTYFSILVDCVVFGLFISAYICLTSIILVDMLGLEKLTNAFGLLCMFRGAASMLGPPLAGALFDMTQSYGLTFGAAGIMLILSSVMAFFINIREHTVDQEPDNECNEA